jgi:hypothetical protein
MSKQVRSRDEQRLAERLRREAEASRPAFSAALHERICRELRRSGPFEAPAFRAVARPRRRRRWAFAAVASTCVLGVAIIVWLARGPGHTGAKPRVELAATQGTEQEPDWLQPNGGLAALTGLAKKAPGKLDAWLDSTAATYQWAGIDEDARRTAEMLVSRLPFDVGSPLVAADDGT